jgi:hypothetical protein
MPEKLAPNTESPKLANLAKGWPKEKRDKIARDVCAWWQADKWGRREWEERRNRYYKLWMGLREPKNTPWPGASNVSLPLFAIATNQFHSRSYQAFFAPPGMVKYMPVGQEDVQRAKKCQDFVNWQTMNDMPHFEDEHDKLLLNVPIGGTQFTKTSYDKQGERPSVEYVSGMQLVLPYRTRNLDEARRAAHEVWMHYDEIGRKNSEMPGFYVDFERVTEIAEEFPMESMDQTKDRVETEAYDQNDRPKLFLECHCWLLDDGQYKPMILFVDKDSGTLLRATTRQVQGKPIQYFTDYHFIPNPEGFYSFGFGHFLEPLNEMANTAFNQIFDAGRLSNQPFGFYGRRAGFRKKEIKLYPGSMTEVEDAGQVFFPTMQRVDSVLFQVLGIVQQYTEGFTSTSDYLLGREAKGTKNPTATGTTAIIEQGLVLYNVMIKRLFRSLKKELRLIHTCNQLYLPEEKQYRVLGFEGPMAFPKIKRKDFDGRFDVIPLGDPSYASRGTRRQEAIELMQLMMGHPLVGVQQPGMQVGSPELMMAGLKEIIETYDKKSLMGYLPKLPEPSMGPIAENALFIQGDAHDPKPGEPHIEHLKVHLGLTQSPYWQSLEEERKDLVRDHIRKTEALLYQETAAQAALGGLGPAQPMGPEGPAAAPAGAPAPGGPMPPGEAATPSPAPEPALNGGGGDY